MSDNAQLARTAATVARFWSKVNKGGPVPDGRPEIGPCWEWTSGRTAAGYGRFYLAKRKPVYAHRYTWELLRGSIPDGLQIDHLCRNRACCNPDHLEPVTNRENGLRGVGAAAVNARKTHCKHGHEFTPENTYEGPRGRQCRRCRADGMARSHQRRRNTEPPKERSQCKSGHPLDDNNVYMHGGTRRCRTCRNEASRRYQERQQAKRDAQTAT